MCITEYNEKTFINGILAEGVVKGRNGERIDAIRRMLKQNFSKDIILSLEYSAEEIALAEKHQN